MPVAIVGDRGCGKSVFVSLLTTAADQYAIETGGHSFRWTQDAGYATRVGELQKSLKTQRWPPANIKGTLSGYTFTFGYFRTVVGTISKQLMKVVTAGRRKPPPNMIYNGLTFRLYDIAGEDLEFIKQIAEKRSGGFVNIHELLSERENLRTILDCDVLVFLIDASRITARVGTKEYEKMLDYDIVMSTLIAAVADYKSKTSNLGAAGKLYPVFVFTKFDMVDKMILESVGVPSLYAQWSKDYGKGRTFTSLFKNEEMKNRRMHAIKLMAKFYGRTLNLIYGGLLKGVDFDDGQYFFSQVTTQLSEEGLPVPKLRSSHGGTVHSMDYAYPEYRAFISYFQKLAKKMKKMEQLSGSVTGLGG